jgi:ubiquinone/menaquinone biosynthesis C-methylase UbiE
MRDGTGLADCGADIVMLFNLLHCEQPLDLLAEARRTLQPGGRVGVVHWRSDIPTPRGPDLSIRPSPEQCAAWLREAG